MGSAEMHGGQFSDSQETCIETPKLSDRDSAYTKKLRFLLLRNRVFRLRIGQIWVMPSCNVVEELHLRNRV